jgi:hypoxanthine phosphoribosyltransferase
MKIKGLEFTEFIAASDIKRKVRSLAAHINEFYKGRVPVLLPVLNGSFMFAADLLKYITIECRVSFVKVSSYDGVLSSGQLRTLIGLDESLFNQDVLIVEDIVDTGLTLQKIVGELKSLGAKSVEVASLLRKEPARVKETPVRFVGFDIGNEFVLGYGLDYDGLGRNYPMLFRAVKAPKG